MGGGIFSVLRSGAGRAMLLCNSLRCASALAAATALRLPLLLLLPLPRSVCRVLPQHLLCLHIACAHLPPFRWWVGGTLTPSRCLLAPRFSCSFFSRMVAVGWTWFRRCCLRLRHNSTAPSVPHAVSRVSCCARAFFYACLAAQRLLSHACGLPCACFLLTLRHRLGSFWT